MFCSISTWASQQAIALRRIGSLRNLHLGLSGSCAVCGTPLLVITGGNSVRCNAKKLLYVPLKQKHLVRTVHSVLGVCGV